MKGVLHGSARVSRQARVGETCGHHGGRGQETLAQHLGQETLAQREGAA